MCATNGVWEQGSGTDVKQGTLQAGGQINASIR